MKKYKKRNFDEDSALRYLHGHVAKHGKIIRIIMPFNGLKMCSAYDYLTNHCGYNR